MGEAGMSSDAPNEDWTKVNYELPKEIAEYTGPGRTAIRDMSRMMIFLTAHWPAARTGLSLAEASRELQRRLGYRTMTVIRAWSALQLMGHVASIYEYPTEHQLKRGAHCWVGPIPKTFSVEPDRVYEREVTEQRTKQETEDREEAKVRATPWATILRSEGWDETDGNSSCGCPIWSAPGVGPVPAMVTAHGSACVLFFHTGDAPLRILTDSAPGAVGLAAHAYGSPIITKTQVVIYGQGLARDYRVIRGKEVESEAERRFWESYVNLHPLALDGLIPQHKVPPYRLDFAIPSKKIGIEIDGYEYHSDKETFTNDRRRQRDLELIGWRLIRFSGKEACDTPDQCVVSAARLVTVFQGAT